MTQHVLCSAKEDHSTVSGNATFLLYDEGQFSNVLAENFQTQPCRQVVQDEIRGSHQNTGEKTSVKKTKQKLGKIDTKLPHRKKKKKKNRYMHLFITQA